MAPWISRCATLTVQAPRDLRPETLIDRDMSAGLKIRENQSATSLHPVAVEQRHSACLFTAAAVVLGAAVEIGLNDFVVALLWVAVSFVITVTAVANPFPRKPFLTDRQLTAAVAIGILLELQVRLMHYSDPIRFKRAFQLFSFDLALLFSAALLWLSVAGSRRRRNLFFGLMLTVYFGMGVFTLNSIHPIIDLIPIHRDAAATLLNHENPYAMTFENIYTPEETKRFYAPGQVVGNAVQYGYPYLPLSLILTAPAQILAGDFRYANLLAVVLSGLLIGYMRPGTLSKLAAALFLFTPTAFFIVAHGWIEPFVILALAAVIFCAVHRPGLLPYAFGLFVVSKQYLILAVPASLLLIKPLKWRNIFTFFLKAGMAGGAVVLPFALWNLHAFIHSVTHQFALRDDGLSFYAAFLRWGIEPGEWFMWTGPAVAAALLVWRLRPSPAAFAAAVAAFYFAVFAFNRLAYANYYFFVIGALCIAAGATETAEQRSVETLHGS